MTGGGSAPAMVIFGSSGNLATTRLIPAIEDELKEGRLRRPFTAAGVDRRRPGRRPNPWFTFVPGDLSRPEVYARLSRAVGDGPPPGGGTLFYLATEPRLFPGIISRLKEAGLARGARVAVEKPFGVDLKSARLLEGRLASAFPEERVFRVDHFLFKDGAISLEDFRFADGRLEGAWNNSHVDCVQIMADEDKTPAGRGGFYDAVGVARDMVQNHLLQLLCLVAMDRPGRGPRSCWGEKAKVLKEVAPILAKDVAWGQYRGYRRLRGVRKGSRTPTFVALKLMIKNPRWDGVPFYLRSGRPLARDRTEVVVKFKETGAGRLPRLVRFRVGPEPRTTLSWKGSELECKHRRLSGEDGSEYGRVVRGALTGDRRRFVEKGFNELSWKLFDGVIRREVEPEEYDAGGFGPESADLLLARDGRSWLDGRKRP